MCKFCGCSGSSQAWEAIYRWRIPQRNISEDFRTSILGLLFSDMPLSAKTVQDRTVKMAENVTRQQMKDINSALAYAIACDIWISLDFYLLNKRRTGDCTLFAFFVQCGSGKFGFLFLKYEDSKRHGVFYFKLSINQV